MDLRKSDNENPKKSKKNVLFKRYKSHDQNDSSEGPQDNSWFLDRLVSFCNKLLEVSAIYNFFVNKIHAQQKLFRGFFGICTNDNNTTAATIT